jgi:hypothetical protein
MNEKFLSSDRSSFAKKRSGDRSQLTTSRLDTAFLKFGLFSGMIVSCCEKTWSLHNKILCMRSAWFDKVLNCKAEAS